MPRWRNALTAPFGIGKIKATAAPIAPPCREARGLSASSRCRAADLVKIARGERRIDGFEEISAIALPAPVWLTPFDVTTPSIGVSRFANLSDDATNEHFADGLAEELLNVLEKFPACGSPRPQRSRSRATRKSIFRL